MAFTDNFSGTAGDFLVGRTGWTKFGLGANDQSPQINGSNQLRVPSYGAEDAPLVGQDTGNADHYIQFTALSQFPWSGAIRLRVGVRCGDRTAGWWVTYNANESVWELLQNNSRVSTYSAAFASGTVVRMEAEGSAIRVKLNGVERLSATDTTHTGNIHVGILGTTAYGTGNDPIMDDWESGTLGGSPPTLTIPTATATSATTSSGSVSTDQGAGTLYWLTNTSSTATVAAVKAGSSQSVTATGTQSTTSTGLTAGTTYYTHFVHSNGGLDSTVATSASFTTPAPSDVAPPTMNGSITVGTKTSGSISISYPAASDNVAVTGYEVSTNGTTWSDNGTSLSYTFLGLSAMTSYTLYVRAYDAAGNRAATPLTVTTSTYRAGDTAANILANTGPIGAGQPGFLHAFASTVSPTAWVSYRPVSGPTPPGGTLVEQPDGRFTYTGPAPATMVIQPEVNGVNAIETITVTLYDQTVDVDDGQAMRSCMWNPMKKAINA